ncbi:hypothetical protein SAMN04487906_0326 [Zhouia amylolytica]|uniref:Uncharacterized protein n=1 Tax=Zhouia amylolytica TaxID=376730 RepID=A0A1I6PJ36_9FLAO|nr:hypothetical protein SAMN04487906_0326 [Zhouia amylolytica]
MHYFILNLFKLVIHNLNRNGLRNHENSFLHETPIDSPLPFKMTDKLNT